MKILDQLSSIADSKDIKFILIGGHAINSYGASRQTADVDILALVDDREIWKTELLKMGYRVFNENQAFLQLSPPDLGQWPIDLMFVGAATLQGLWSDSREVRLGGEASIRVPSVEHLIALKLNALKQAGKMRELKDLADIMELAKIAEIDPRSENFKQLCLKYGTNEVYEKILSAWY